MRFAVACILFAVAIVATSAQPTDREAEFRVALSAWMPRLFGIGSRIRGPLDIATVEREAIEAVSECSTCPQVPFGYMNHFWEKFKREIRPGDSLVFFRSDQQSWKGGYGRDGYAIIRNGKVVKTMIRNGS
jgi:hypothetical protein